MTLGILGIAAAQINTALDAIFARVADLSGPVYLWYAIRVQQLPLALFGLALSGALLPPLSRAIQMQEMDRFYHFLHSALSRGAVLVIPSAFGLIALGGAGLNVLYGHGHFHVDDVQRTVECLWAYAAGLIPSVMVSLLSQAFYAKSLYWIPARASLISVLVNMFLNTLFVFGFGWGAVSIALATSVSSVCNGYLLLCALKESIHGSFIQLVIRLTIVSALTTILTLVVQYIGFQGLAQTGLGQWIQFLSLGGIFLGGFLGGAYLLSIKEVWEFMSLRQMKKFPD